MRRVVKHNKIVMRGKDEGKKKESRAKKELSFQCAVYSIHCLNKILTFRDIHLILNRRSCLLVEGPEEA